MKKQIISALFCLLLLAFVSSTNADLIIGTTGITVGGATPDCSEDFNTANTNDVDGNTNFDSESGADADDLDIYSNALRWYADAIDEVGYVTESTCIANESELTVKFDVYFDDILEVASGIDNLTFIHFEDSSYNASFDARFDTNASNDIDNYYCRIRTAGKQEEASGTTMTSLAADTWYSCYVYVYHHATGGGCEMKCGSWSATNTGFDNDTDDYDTDWMRLGAIDSDWGDGTTDTYVRFDNFEIYKSDQR